MQRAQSYRIIGRAWPRHDVLDKVQGHPIYASDFTMPGMLHGRVLRSLYPSARILRIDASEAQRLPGVACVLTHKDVPRNEIRTVLPARMAEPGAGAAMAIRPILAVDRVRFLGEAIALVAAETPEIAAQALELIQVEYEEMPGVYDPLEAMKPDAPQVHEGGNIFQQWHIRKGDVALGFEDADVMLEHTYCLQLLDHVAMETEGGVAWVDPDGTLVIKVGTQVIEHYRAVAEALQIPQNRIRLIAVPVGGGFGGREDITVEILVGLLGWHARRPVRLVYSREECFLARGKRTPYILRYKMGARRDGVLTALKAEIISDCGAYAELNPWILYYSTVTSTGPYRIPNVHVDATAVCTNNTFSSAFRGFGSAQACFAYECHMDAMAQALGMTPREFRERNYLKKGNTISSGWALESEPLLDELTRRAWEALGSPPKAEPGKLTGRGMAAGFQPYGRMCWTHDSASVWVGMELDGTAMVRCAVPDIGGGQMASLVAIAAEVLGLPLDRVTIGPADSHLAPRGGTSTATRQLYMCGNAVFNAASEVRNNLIAQAAEILGVPEADIQLVEGEAVATNGKRLSLAEVVPEAHRSGRSVQSLSKYDAPSADIIDPMTGQGKPFNDYTFGVQVAEVEVDEETGQVTLRKFATAFDVGKAINRAAVEGQLQGGACMGIGDALMEEVVIEEGFTRNPHLIDYKLPTTLDVPDITAIVVESGQGLGPFGSKGVGEPALVPTRPAVVNAVSNAIGVPLRDAPLTPERVYRAMRAKGST
ncbi:MAG: xanthine dehydrogenase family protein molybdopterin-binding subunit [Dehalococcoidia bacterium]